MIVVVFCDGGEKYLSERFWDEERRGRTLIALQSAASTQAIRAHGAETYPNECCGALYRPRRRGHRDASRCRTRPRKGRGAASWFGHRTNARPSGARRSLAPSCSASTIRIPDHPARPSQYDLDHAWPFFSYIIVSVRAATPEDMTSWRLRETTVRAFDARTRLHLCRTQFTFRRRCARSPTSRSPCEVSGATVGELLADLTTQYDGLRKHLYTDDGQAAELRQRVPERRGHPLPAARADAGQSRATR